MDGYKPKAQDWSGFPDNCGTDSEGRAIYPLAGNSYWQATGLDRNAGEHLVRIADGFLSLVRRNDRAEEPEHFTLKEKIMMRKTWLCLAMIVLVGAGAQAREFKWFVDTFDGTELDARWTNDNSPANYGGSVLCCARGARSWPSEVMPIAAVCHQEAYNHLECDIDADLNFAVQIDSRINRGMTFGGNHLVVYWDPVTYVSLHWGRSQSLDVSYFRWHGLLQHRREFDVVGRMGDDSLANGVPGRRHQMLCETDNRR